MAKKTTTRKIAPPALPQEVAQIVFFLVGVEGSQVVRYTNMRDAMRQFDQLMAAADKGEGYVLNGASSTAVIRHPQNITTAFLVSVAVNNALMADTQKKFNGLMQG